MVDDPIIKSLISTFPGPSQEILQRLVDYYRSLKSEFFSGRFPEAMVKAGNFATMVFSYIHFVKTGNITLQPDITGLYDFSRKHPNILNIYRLAQWVWGMRSKREGAHPSRITPNMIDAFTIESTCSWLLAELVRINSNLPVNKVQRIIQSIIIRKAPLIQEIGGVSWFLADASLRAKILLLIYHKGILTREQLEQSLQYEKRSSVGSEISRLKNKLLLVEDQQKNLQITYSGVIIAEKYQAKMQARE